MISRATVLASTAAVLCGAASAQPRIVVNPPANAAVEGTSRITFPFSGNATMRYQQIASFRGNAGLINKVAFRRDNDVIVNSPDYVAFSPDFDLTLSTSPRTPVTISATFANNVGNDVRMVHSGVLNWPAAQKVPPGPTPFVYTVPITQPFLYTGQQDLCLDIARRGYTNPNTSFFLDAAAGSIGTISSQLGVGCPNASVNNVVVYDSWAPGARARILQYNAASGTPTALVIGDSSTNWGPIILPLDLMPFGAPGCRIYTSHSLTIPGTNSNATTPYGGRWEFITELPMDPSLGGATLFMQFYNINDFNAANALNLSVSSGHSITIANPMPGQPAHSEAHASVLTATEALLVQQGYGFVLEITM